MKNRIFFVFVALVGALFALTSAETGEPAANATNASLDTNMIPLVSYNYGGRLYVCCVTESNFFRSPSWQPDKGEPLLSPRRALEIAQKRAALLVPKSQSFTPREIALKSFVGIWCYVVELEPENWIAPGVRPPAAPVKIVVLMDGTVAEPIEAQPKG
jgi:hypothetical protein